MSRIRQRTHRKKRGGGKSGLRANASIFNPEDSLVAEYLPEPEKVKEQPPRKPMSAAWELSATAQPFQPPWELEPEPEPEPDPEPEPEPEPEPDPEPEPEPGMGNLPDVVKAKILTEIALGANPIELNELINDLQKKHLRINDEARRVGDDYRTDRRVSQGIKKNLVDPKSLTAYQDIELSDSYDPNVEDIINFTERELPKRFRALDKRKSVILEMRDAHQQLRKLEKLDLFKCGKFKALADADVTYYQNPDIKQYIQDCRTKPTDILIDTFLGLDEFLIIPSVTQKSKSRKRSSLSGIQSIEEKIGSFPKDKFSHGIRKGAQRALLDTLIENYLYRYPLNQTSQSRHGARRIQRENDILSIRNRFDVLAFYLKRYTRESVSSVHKFDNLPHKPEIPKLEKQIGINIEEVIRGECARCSTKNKVCTFELNAPPRECVIADCRNENLIINTILEETRTTVAYYQCSARELLDKLLNMFEETILERNPKDNSPEKIEKMKRYFIYSLIGFDNPENYLNTLVDTMNKINTSLVKHEKELIEVQQSLNEANARFDSLKGDKLLLDGLNIFRKEEQEDEYQYMRNKSQGGEDIYQRILQGWKERANCCGFGTNQYETMEEAIQGLQEEYDRKEKIEGSPIEEHINNLQENYDRLNEIIQNEEYKYEKMIVMYNDVIDYVLPGMGKQFEGLRKTMMEGPYYRY